MIDAAGLYSSDGIDYLHKRPNELLVDIQLPQRLACFVSKSCAGAERLIFLCWASRRGSRSTRMVKDARIVLGGIARHRQLKSKKLPTR